MNLSEEIMSQPSPVSDNAYKKQSSKESCLEASEEYALQPSSEIGSKQAFVDSLEESSSQSVSDNKSGNEQSIDKVNGDCGQGPLEISVSQPFLNSENEVTGRSVEAVQDNSNEKKRSLDIIAGDSYAFQSHRLPKKSKSGQSLNLQNGGSPVVDCQNKSRSSKGSVEADDIQEKHTGSSGKRRRSRWDMEAKGEGEQGEGGKTSKRRKSRWADDFSQLKILGPIQLPNFVTEPEGTNPDPEVRKLKMKLLKINQKLLGADVQDSGPEGKKCLQQTPLLGNFGVRTNPMDTGYYKKLIKDRQAIISRLIKKNPTFKPPLDYQPPKFSKKLYIPLKEYPGYNFVGLIIGPRGNTQKRMEKETGAKILLRGKGSMKEKKGRQKFDLSDNDDLHVAVEADNQKSLDEAVKMVEKLLIPVAEGRNDHKRAQLRELAKLNGNLRDDNLCRICGEEGHKQYACPNQSSSFLTRDNNFCKTSSEERYEQYACLDQNSTFLTSEDHPRKTSSEEEHRHCAFLNQSSSSKEGHSHYAHLSRSPVFLKIDASSEACGGSSHTMANCLSSLSTHCRNHTYQYNNFPADMKRGGFGDRGPPASSYTPRGFGTSPSRGSNYRGGFHITPAKDYRPDQEADNASLYVGNLPLTVDEKHLVSLFSRFGRITEAKVIRDSNTGLSKGYGFVMYEFPTSVEAAKAYMQGYTIDGKVLVVGVAGCSPVASFSRYPHSVMGLRDGPSQVVSPRLRGAMQSESEPSSTEDDAGLPPLSVFLGHSEDSSNEQNFTSSRSPCYVPITSPSSLSHFPGNPRDSRSSTFQFVITHESNSKWRYLPQSLHGNLITIPRMHSYFPVGTPQMYGFGRNNES